jgi:desampylase
MTRRALTVRVGPGVMDAIRAHARAERPNECCGLLVGVDERIVAAVPARNLRPTPHDFLIDPRDHLDAEKRARAEGLEVVGFYHSHPDAPAVPSRRDREEMTYTNAWYAICGPLERRARPAVRLYRWIADAFEPARIQALTRRGTGRSAGTPRRGRRQL